MACKQIIAECGPALDADALSKMPYADATVKEVLRCANIIAALNRRALKTFEVGGYTIPKVSC